MVLVSRGTRCQYICVKPQVTPLTLTSPFPWPQVSINGEGWTVNKMRYGYFANTAARNCIAYGPGLLDKGVSGLEMPFLIQVRAGVCQAVPRGLMNP